ncbi:MAG: methyltransferase domain-containing protein [Dermatophilaceae bacterium]
MSAPEVREAWRELLLSVLPAPPARVADLGCGTGTLTRLLTDQGYTVDGLDFSTAMIERARLKVPEARFVVGDAATPELPGEDYHVVLSRHVLWAMNDPQAAFAKWVGLLKPGGVVVLIEGHWSTGAGLTAEQTRTIVLSARQELRVVSLPEEIYWGKAITDERYLAVSHR